MSEDNQVVLSSTRLARFLDCERKSRLAFVSEAPKPSRAMAYGTVFHACVEFRLERGRWPSKADIWKEKGNYEDPRVSLQLFPDLWDDVGVYFDFEPLLDRIDEIRAMDGAVVEKPLADFGLTLADGKVLATGFFDVLIESERLIVDWKTRGGLRYAPKKPEDFFGNVQLCYYAAALAQIHPDWKDVTVRHENCLRPDRGGPRLVPYEATIDRWYLERVWEKLNEEIAPAYHDALTRSDPHALPYSSGACYKYGKPCPYMAQCDSMGSPLGEGIVDGDQKQTVDFFDLIEQEGIV